MSAKEAVYKFVFDGRSSVWPIEEGKLVLTADDENGEEPTYPYTRLLLRFDAESFLHTLDLAFEDSFLNDSDSSISRQKIRHRSSLRYYRDQGDSLDQDVSTRFNVRYINSKMLSKILRLRVEP